MEFIEEASDLGKAAYRTGSKLFQEKVWTVRPRRLVLLFAVALLCLCLFLGYRLHGRNYSFGFTHKHKLEKAAADLKQSQDIYRQINIMRNITEERVGDGKYALDVTKIQSAKVRESALELEKCGREFDSLKEVVGVYGGGARKAIGDLQALKNEQ